MKDLSRIFKKYQQDILKYLPDISGQKVREYKNLKNR